MLRGRSCESTNNEVTTSVVSLIESRGYCRQRSDFIFIITVARLGHQTKSIMLASCCTSIFLRYTKHGKFDRILSKAQLESSVGGGQNDEECCGISKRSLTAEAQQLAGVAAGRVLDVGCTAWLPGDAAQHTYPVTFV